MEELKLAADISYDLLDILFFRRKTGACNCLLFGIYVEMAGEWQMGEIPVGVFRFSNISYFCACFGSDFFIKKDLFEKNIYRNDYFCG